MKKIILKIQSSLFLAAFVILLIFSGIDQAQAASGPAATSVTVSYSNASGTKVTWKKVSKVSGYVVQASASADFPAANTVTATVSSRTLSYSLKWLNRDGADYYIRVRSYIKKRSKKYYSGWTTVSCTCSAGNSRSTVLNNNSGNETKVWKATGKARIAVTATPSRALKNALLKSGAKSVTKVSSSVNVSRYDALVIPGGVDVRPLLYGQDLMGASASSYDLSRDLSELAIIDKFVKAGKPILGICRGAQILNVYFGGTLNQNIGQSHNKVTGTAYAVSDVNSVLKKVYGNSTACYCTHHESVNDPGTGLVITQRSQDGQVEAYEHVSLPVIGIQWHPEQMDSSHWGIFQYFIQTMVKKGYYIKKGTVS